MRLETWWLCKGEAMNFNINLPLVLKVAVVGLAITLAVLSFFVGPFKGNPDNPVIKEAEVIVHDETGFDVASVESDVEKLIPPKAV
jgi:hypothetical protein